jgi:hypothetical protein
MLALGKSREGEYIPDLISGEVLVVGVEASVSAGGSIEMVGERVLGVSRTWLGRLGWVSSSGIGEASSTRSYAVGVASSF